MVNFMNSDFVSLLTVSDKVGIEKIIDDWFSKRINLFVYFSGSGKKCRLSRCISPSLHIGGEKVISDGDEFYMMSDSPAHSILKFIPDLPLAPHLKIKEGFKISRSIQGKYFNYEYSGTALGFWMVVPTQKSTFNNGSYYLTDKDSFIVQDASSGAVYVYSVYDEDYLKFDGEEKIRIDDLYIENSVLNTMDISKKLHGSIGEEEETKMDKMFETKRENIAVYLLMHETVVRNNNVAIVSKFIVDYECLWGVIISEATLLDWFKKPDMFTNIRQRIKTEKRMGLYLFLKLFCEKNFIDHTKSNASAIAVELNKLAASASFQLDKSFTVAEVKKWLTKPAKISAS